MFELISFLWRGVSTHSTIGGLLQSQSGANGAVEPRWCPAPEYYRGNMIGYGGVQQRVELIYCLVDTDAVQHSPRD